MYVDHVASIGRQLFEAVRQVGAEGIGSKRRGSAYRAGESRDWIKSKAFEVGEFAVTAFSEVDDGPVEALYVAEASAGKLVPAGTVKFGLAGKGLRNRLDALRSGPGRNGFVPVRPKLVAHVKTSAAAAVAGSGMACCCASRASTRPIRLRAPRSLP